MLKTMKKKKKMKQGYNARKDESFGDRDWETKI